MELPGFFRLAVRLQLEGTMNKILIASVAVLALAVSGSVKPAMAGNGGAVAAGVIGGLAAGAIIGSQANRNYYSGPAYVEPAYVAPDYRRCHIERQQVVDGYGNYRVQRVRVCD
jgi:hypothetical protein